MGISGGKRGVTMNNKYADVITGAIGLALGIAMLVMSVQIGLIEGKAIGADFLPKIASMITILMSGKLLLDGWRSSKVYKKEETLEYVKNYRGVAVMMVLCVLYAEFLKPIGFIVTSLIFLFLTLCMISKKEERSYVKFAVITVVTVFAIYFIFRKFFGIRLPTGIL